MYFGQKFSIFLFDVFIFFNFLKTFFFTDIRCIQLNFIVSGYFYVVSENICYNTKKFPAKNVNEEIQKEGTCNLAIALQYALELQHTINEEKKNENITLFCYCC